MVGAVEDEVVLRDDGGGVLGGEAGQVGVVCYCWVESGNGVELM